MERIKIAQIFADQEQFGGKEVLVSGWARTCLLYTSDAADD